MLHTNHVWKVATTVGTPRCPEVEHHVATFQFAQTKGLAVGGRQAEGGGLCAWLQQCGGILSVVVCRSSSGSGCICVLCLGLCPSGGCGCHHDGECCDEGFTIHVLVDELTSRQVDKLICIDYSRFIILIDNLYNGASPFLIHHGASVSSLCSFGQFTKNSCSVARVKAVYSQ